MVALASTRSSHGRIAAYTIARLVDTEWGLRLSKVLALTAAGSLIISGEKTAAVHRLIDPELARVIQGAERIVITDGTHGMWVEQPKACAAAIGSFIARQKP
jgi:pimeloyl-ACP methyl ester carboxylesterase